MKDKDARVRLRILEEVVSSCLKAVVKDCPKCKHETPQVENKFRDIPSFYYSYPNYDFLCLVCGSKLRYTTATTCRIVKESAPRNSL